MCLNLQDPSNNEFPAGLLLLSYNNLWKTTIIETSTIFSNRQNHEMEKEQLSRHCFDSYLYLTFAIKKAIKSNQGQLKGK